MKSDFKFFSNISYGKNLRKICAAVLAAVVGVSVISLGSALAGNVHIKATAAKAFEECAIGSTPEGTSVSDLGWRPGTTSATATVTRGSAAIGFTKALSLHSDVAEGQGPYNATPLISISTEVPVKPETHMIMLYMKAPTIGTKSLDAWPVEWSVRLNSIRVHQSATSKSDLWATLKNGKYSYLGIRSSAWVDGTMDANGTLSLPSGFEGYVKFYINDADNWEQWKANGFQPNKEYAVDMFQFVFGWFGGEYGDFSLQGAYTVTENSNSTDLKLDDSEPVSMTESVDAMEGNPKFNFTDTIGEKVPTSIVSISDAGFRQGTTQAMAVYGETAGPAGIGNSIHIKSAVAEGQGPDNATPSVTYWNYTNVNSSTNCVMLYLELPAVGDKSVDWTTRITALSFSQLGIGDWFFSDFRNSSISYLSVDSREWKKATTDGEGTLPLPGGFKGYIKLYLDTCNNYENWKNSVGFDPEKDYTLNTVDFKFGWLGGEYGDFVIDNIYSITSDRDSQQILLNGTTLKSLIIEDNSIVATTLFDLSGKTDGTAADFVACYNHDGWRPGTSELTAKFAAQTSPIGKQKSVCISSVNAEGEGPYNAAPYAQMELWANISSNTNAVILYVETPRYPDSGDVQYSLRIGSLGIQQSGIGEMLWSDYNSSMYRYLADNGTKWITEKSSSFGNLNLPSGFKGYIELYIDACPGYVSWIGNKGFDAKRDYQLAYLTLDFGYIGGEYGDCVIGGIYLPTKDTDSTMIRLDAAAPVQMTRYADETESLVNEFCGLAAAFDSNTLAGAADIARAEDILIALPKEAIDAIDKTLMQNYETARAEIQKYRPEMLGASLLAENPALQKIKLGAQINTASASAEGYTVKESGILWIPATMYDKNKPLTKSHPGAVLLDAGISDSASDILGFSGVYSFASNQEYNTIYLARAYVIYHNEQTGNDITMYSGDYTFADGTTARNFSVTANDAMRYFGLSVYGTKQ